MAFLEHEACTSRAPTVAPEHAPERADFGEPIHSHSHSQKKTLKTYPSQAEGIRAASTVSEVLLRPYQANAIQNCRLVLAGGVVRLLLCSPTGSGKTETAMAMIAAAVLKGTRVMFVVNRVGLVLQASRRFDRAGIRHGIIQGNNTTRVYEQVLVCSIQTLSRRGIPEDVGLVIIDEAHGVAGSVDYRKLIAAVKCPVVGLSATPFSKGLGKHYDELGGPLFERMVVAATIPELISDGYLVDCEIYAPAEPDMSGIKQTRNAFGEMDYSDADVARAVDKAELVGDIVSHWFRLAFNTPTVVFAASIAHSKHIVERFQASGITAEHLDCFTPDEERQAIFARFDSGETKIISNVAILAEGWDAPHCSTMILARPTRSLIRYIQMCGRILRPYEGKTRGLILDHSGSVQHLGYPTADLPLELDAGTASKGGGTKQVREKLPKACSSCKYVKPVGVHKCPVCGFEPEIQPDIRTAEGELVPISKRTAKADKQAIYSQLLAYARIKGYSANWAAHKYRDVFKVWPRGLQDVTQEPTPEILRYIKSMNIRFAKRRGGRDD